MNANLTGQWDGVFSYPDVPEAGPTTPFLVALVERGGVLSGTTMEPHEYRHGTAHAKVVGQRIGVAVHFAKTYHEAGPEYAETVRYYGKLSEDGDSITGEWQIDHWHGPFEMTREAVPVVELEQETEAHA